MYFTDVGERLTLQYVQLLEQGDVLGLTLGVMATAFTFQPDNPRQSSHIARLHLLVD